ncbi:ARM repeat-containing protein [Xylona heveae TC161]|uniref:ARM repeat-containing protein n=1 Tax=Xylona heveae (strain CBS 132557 / TC161) TaxID=1328760 RepID=A0A164ZIU0_XYLHT|nr:ARM repeat-containing protein [Xylona heveae TC161]KZF19150.1 ARM repeat-containing protein [Xylona heveae TC161]
MASIRIYPPRPTSTGGLIRRLKDPDIDQKEGKTLRSLAGKMIEEFRDNPKPSYIPEATLLSTISTDQQYERLISTFGNVIIKGTTDGDILDRGILAGFTFVLRRCSGALSAETAKLGSVLGSLAKRLKNAIDQAEMETQYQLVCLLSNVLDAMVDIKISGLGREPLHEPLLRILCKLEEHKEPRLAQAARYARQALLGVSDDEGPYAALWRYSFTAIKAATKITAAVTTKDPTKILDASSDLLKLLSLLNDLREAAQEAKVSNFLEGMKSLSKKKGWYVALRYTDMLLKAQAFQMLQSFLKESPYYENEQFLCGLYSQLEQAWLSGDKLVKDRVIDLLTCTLTQPQNEEQQLRQWIGLIANTLDQPCWNKCYLHTEEHKFRIWKNSKNKAYEPKLTAFLEENPKLEDHPAYLLETVWSQCNDAKSFYADNRIREYYREGDNLKIKRLSGDYLPIQHCYINLSILEVPAGKAANETRNPESQISRFSLFNRLKVNTAETGKEVHLPDLFSDRKIQDGGLVKPRRILIRGRAGVGKTSLCKKIVHDFLCGQMWNDLYDRLIWIPLRRLKGKNHPKDFLAEEFFFMHGERDSLVSALWDAICGGMNERTLLLLDGLDEIAAEPTQSGNDLAELFKGLFNQKNVIVTSRPYAKLPGFQPFDIELEAVGFRPAQMQTYLETVVNDRVALQQIQEFIKGHELIEGLVQIPIQLDALCYSWDGKVPPEDVPNTMTTLYRAIELRLWKKDILQLGKRNYGELLSEAQVQLLETQSQVKRHVQGEIDLLQKLSFTGLYNDIIEFNKYERNKVYEHLELFNMSDHILDKLSFLRSSDSASKGHDRSYHFIHLTFQEYFAAQYFVRCWQSNQPLSYLKLSSARKSSIVQDSTCKFLQREKYNGRYDLFWSFVAGLLQAQDEEQLLQFLDVLEDEPRDLLGPVHQRRLVNCFYELASSDKYPNLEQRRAEMEHHLKRWLLFELNWTGRTPFCRDTEFPGRIIHHILNTESEDIQQRVMEGFKSTSQFSPTFSNQIASYLQNDVSLELKLTAASSLRFQEALPESTLLALWFVLKDDESKELRGRAARALRKQAALPESILNAMLSQPLTSHTMPDVSTILCNQSSLPENVLGRLVSLLEFADCHSVRHAHNILFHHSRTSKIAFQYTVAQATQLQNHDSGVKARVFSTLPLGRSFPEPLLKALAALLNDDNKHISSSALLALIDQSVLPEKISRAVAFQLDNAGLHARKSLLERLQTNVYIPEIILQAIAAWLNDDNPGIRITTLNVLAVQRRRSEPVFLTIASQLNNSNYLIRRAAINALSNGHSLPENIFPAIVTRLGDDEPRVRESALHALRKQPTLPATILHAIATRLDDDVPEVRLSAFNALGEQPILPETILHIIVARLEDCKPRVRGLALHALRKQPTLPATILHAIATRLDDDVPEVRLSAFNTLGKQHALPETILLDMVARLDDHDPGARLAAFKCLSERPALPEKILRPMLPKLADLEITYEIEETLMKSDYFPSIFQDLDSKVLQSIYHKWIKRSFSEQLSCYIDDGILHVDTPERQSEVVLGPDCHRVLQAFKAEASKMGSPRFSEDEGAG